MSEFNGVTLTNAGKVILAKAISGKPLKFSRVSCGDGILGENQDICEFENLINSLYDLKIHSCEIGFSPGIAELKASLDTEILPTKCRLPL